MDLQAANPSPGPPHPPSLLYPLDLMNLTLFHFLEVSIAALLLLLQGLLFYMYPWPGAADPFPYASNPYAGTADLQ